MKQISWIAHCHEQDTPEDYHEYRGSIAFETDILLQRACTLMGEHLFRQILEEVEANIKNQQGESDVDSSVELDDRSI